RRHLWRGRARRRRYAGAGGASAAPALMAHRGEARRACLRRHRARYRLCRQRPARRHAGLCGAELSQPLRRGARRACRGVHRLRRWLAEGIEMHGAGPWPVFAGAVVKEARGGQKLRSVIVRDDKGVETEIACDLLAVSNGWNPTLHLTCHLGGKPVWQEALPAFVPGSKPKDLAVGGAAAGHLSLAEALEDGARFGAEAARDLGFSASVPAMPSIGGEDS